MNNPHPPNTDEARAFDVIMLRHKSKIVARMRELKQQLPPLAYGRVRFMVTMQLGMLRNYVYYSWAPRIQPEEIIDDISGPTVREPYL